MGRGGAGRPRGVGARVDGRRGVFEGVVKEGAFLRREGEEEHAYKKKSFDAKRKGGAGRTNVRVSRVRVADASANVARRWRLPVTS